MHKDTDGKILEELLKELHSYFMFHTNNERAEFVFLLLGIIYFCLAIYKYTMELFFKP